MGSPPSEGCAAIPLLPSTVAAQKSLDPVPLAATTPMPVTATLEVVIPTLPSTSRLDDWCHPAVRNEIGRGQCPDRIPGAVGRRHFEIESGSCPVTRGPQETEHPLGCWDLARQDDATDVCRATGDDGTAQQH